MSAIVCDASVLFKILVAEVDSHIADRVVATSHVVVPELIYAEIGSAIWTHARRRGFPSEFAARIFEAFQSLELEVHGIRAHSRRALDLASTLRHPIYDCLYLALAESLDIRLVTADDRFLATLRKWPGDTGRAVALSDFA